MEQWVEWALGCRSNYNDMELARNTFGRQHIREIVECLLLANNHTRFHCAPISGSQPQTRGRPYKFMGVPILPESTGGEAWGCQDSREGGLQVPVVLRAPFYVGTKSSGLHAGDT